MPTTKITLAAVAMAALLVLAGCAAPVTNGTDGSAPGDAATPDDGTAVGSEAGTVEFYVSDEENAIDDFEHLNVTITTVGLHRADGGDDEEDDEEGDEPTETPELTERDGTEANATMTATVTPTPTPGDETRGEKSDEERKDDGEEKDDERKAGWVEYEVNETVDLTALKGPNATKLESLAAPDGSYDKVFVYVDGIEATLSSGEQVNVKLPSEKLHIDKGFTLGTGQNVSFVFDISVHEAGKSGKYILKPVISESGTSDEVEIEDVDERNDEQDDEGEREDDEETDDEETEATETEEPTETPEADDGNDTGQGDESGNNPSLWAPNG